MKSTPNSHINMVQFLLMFLRNCL